MLAGAVSVPAFAQKGKKAEEKPQGYVFTTVKANPVTEVKDQNETGTCWCFAGISFLENPEITVTVNNKNHAVTTDKTGTATVKVQWQWVFGGDDTAKARPYGSMYIKETTPDGYVADENGVCNK